MALRAIHDLREYSISVGFLDYTAGAGLAAISAVPIPTGGQVVAVMVGVAVSHTGGNSTLSFRLRNVDLQRNGVASTRVVSGLDDPGDVIVVQFDPANPVNWAKEAEDGDAIADGSVLQILSTRNGSTGSGYFVVVVRP